MVLIFHIFDMTSHGHNTLNAQFPFISNIGSFLCSTCLLIIRIATDPTKFIIVKFMVALSCYGIHIFCSKNCNINWRGFRFFATYLFLPMYTEGAFTYEHGFRGERGIPKGDTRVYISRDFISYRGDRSYLAYICAKNLKFCDRS